MLVVCDSDLSVTLIEIGYYILGTILPLALNKIISSCVLLGVLPYWLHLLQITIGNHGFHERDSVQLDVGEDI